MNARWTVGIRVLSLTAVIGAFLVFLGTAAGESRLSVVAGTQQLGHLLLSPEGVLRIPPGTTVVPDRMLVRFRPGVTVSARSDAVSDVDASVGTAYRLVPRLELVRLPAGSSVVSAIAVLSRDPRVQYAVPDLAVRVAATPNDPLYSSQWAPPAIGAPQAWDRTTGSATVKVAVLDSGVVLNHPDLAANLIPGWNFVSNNSVPADDFGHGTHVAGIIGAVGNNGVGVTGINWHVGLMPLKICNSGGLCDLGLEVSALQYAVAHGAKIANASFGGYYGGYQPERDAIAAAGQAGLLYVAAAGNASQNSDTMAPFYPASYPLGNIISVAATTSSGELAWFSNYGFNRVLTAAPGEDILSTLPTSGPLSDPSGYGTESGTSMAAPHVTGAAALLWAEHPDWTMQQIRTRLLTTATPMASLTGEVGDCGQLNVGAATDPALPDEALVCVELSGTGGGSVSSAPAGLDCGATCAASVPVGTQLTLSATPTPGSSFSGWGGACSGSGTCTVNANGLQDVTATFRRSGSPPGWQQKRLPPPAGRDPFPPGTVNDPTILDSFYNVAVSADGTERAKAIYNPPSAGCYYDSTDTGGVFLERRTAAGWVADGKLTAPSVPAYAGDPGARWANCSQFGATTRLSADGTTLLVAPSMDSVYAGPSGFRWRCAAYVYKRGTGGWALDTVLYPPGVGAGGSLTVDGCGFFGGDAGGAISADGTRVAMLTAEQDASPRLIRVDIYALSGGVWGLEQQLTLPSPNFDCEGGMSSRSMSLSGDGSTVLVGNTGCDDAGLSVVGLVFAYARSGTQWTLAQTIHSPTPFSLQDFGYQTALAQDGNTAVIGNLTHYGEATWVFERDETGWHVSALLPHAGSSPGTVSPLDCPAIVEDGARIVCVAYNDDVGFNVRQGAIFIYDRPAGGWASAQPQAQEAFATGGFPDDRTGLVAAPENGSFIDATIGPWGLASGAYQHDRIGYEFTTGAIDKTLSVNASGGGSGSISSDLTGVACGTICWHDYADGALVTLTATPAASSRFVGWSGACSGTGSCALTMSADHTATATFALLPKLSVAKSGSGKGTVTSSPAGISCGSTCAVYYNPGTSVTLTAIPATGSRFVGWNGGGCSGTGGCTVTMSQARSVTATFTLIPESLTVSKSGRGYGTVTSSPSGISCGSTCSHAFNYGTSVTLTARAVSGYVFTGWSGACTGTSPTCHVSMTAARATTAMFAVAKVLTVLKAGTGSGKVTSTPAGISCTATCTHAFAAGTVVTLTASAKSGSKFTGWSGACSGTGKCVVTMSAAKSVKATFKLTAARRDHTPSAARAFPPDR